MFQLNPSRCGPLRESGFVSLIVQLLHSHTYERVNLESFIDKYQQKARLRQQLSLILKTILEHSSKDNKEQLELELQIYDILDVLRMFVEQLYNQKHGRELDYPCYKMWKLSYHSIDKEGLKVLEILGGAFVVVDVLRALFRFCDNVENRQEEVHQIRMYSYRTLYPLMDKDCAMFLSKNEPFISNTKALLDVNDQLNLLEPISMFLSIFSVDLRNKAERLEECEIVAPMLRAVMGIDLETQYYSIQRLFQAIDACIRFGQGTRRQLCLVDGWADFLLSLLEKIVGLRRTKVPQPDIYPDDVTYDRTQSYVWTVLVIMKHRMTTEQQERLMLLCSTPEVVEIMIQDLCSSRGRVIINRLSTLLNPPNRQFIEQLKQFDIITELKRFSTSKRASNINRETVGRMLSILEAE